MDTQFYRLDYTLGDMRYFAGGDWANRQSLKYCPQCRLPLEATEPPEIEITLDHLGRRGFQEYLWNTGIFPVLRSDLTDLWCHHGFSGFALTPVRITRWSEKPSRSLPDGMPSYGRLRTISKVRLLEPPPKGPPCTLCGITTYAFPYASVHLPRGIEVDNASWDGADVFGVAGYEFVYCTRRAAEATLAAGYNRSIAFIRLEDDYRWEFYDVKNPRWTSVESWLSYVQSFQIRHPEDL